VSPSGSRVRQPDHPDPQWSTQAILDQVATGKTRTVRLERPIPVLILYWTATVGHDGRLFDRADSLLHFLFDLTDSLVGFPLSIQLCVAAQGPGSFLHPSLQLIRLAARGTFDEIIAKWVH